MSQIENKTDWDSYYSRPYKTASVTRKITYSVLRKSIAKSFNKRKGFTLTELGGANSCFFDSIRTDFEPSLYQVVDNNQIGLNKLRQRTSIAVPYMASVLDHRSLESIPQTDLVFSVGLIEHFVNEELLLSIDAHFMLARSGGFVVISFPSPTWLYRVTRKCAELLGLWIFHDETPLFLEQIQKHLEGKGEIIYSKIIYPIFLTQTIVVIRKY